MTEGSPTILVVEDDETVLEYNCALLREHGFRVLTADNGRSALQILEKAPQDIDVIVSDVLMPEMDGYELCRKTKQNPLIQHIPFLFVSALSTLDEKLVGYNAGGDDYITKPASQEEMFLKVKRVLDLQKQTKDLQQRIVESNSAAMEAMNYSADLGLILNFYEKSLAVLDYKSLSEAIFETAAVLSLKATIQICSADEVITISSTGQASPLEINVIEMSRQQGRFFDFGARTIINHADFSLLIKNMPIDRPDRYGVLKDTLGALCNAIEARLRIIFENNIEEKRKRVLSTVQSAIEETGQTFEHIQTKNLRAIEDLMAELEDSFISLGLMESQEDQIRRVVEMCFGKINDSFAEGKSINDSFKKIQTAVDVMMSLKK